ncbi:MAG: hypothetical protein ACYDA5_04480 [Vulcanimicrobiaceae bacterium]
MPLPTPRTSWNDARVNALRCAGASLCALALLLSLSARPGAAAGRTPIAAADKTPASDRLPINSSLLFVLDAPISSAASHPGELVPIHLKDPLVVGGHTVAPAGTPGAIAILHAQGAESGDVYGYVDIYFEPLHLPGGGVLPLSTPTSHLTVRVSVGHTSTVALEDEVENILIPGHSLFAMFRRGRNFVLGRGAVVRARTAATVDLLGSGVVAVTTPAPFPAARWTPRVEFSPLPFDAVPGAPAAGPSKHPSADYSVLQ